MNNKFVFLIFILGFFPEFAYSSDAVGIDSFVSESEQQQMWLKIATDSKSFAIMTTAVDLDKVKVIGGKKEINDELDTARLAYFITVDAYGNIIESFSFFEMNPNNSCNSIFDISDNEFITVNDKFVKVTKTCFVNLKKHGFVTATSEGKDYITKTLLNNFIIKINGFSLTSKDFKELYEEAQELKRSLENAI
ncbi:hypothetical protein OLL83_002557 [Shewanella algae]|uniref:hypothetical protein n=1 Tax=Shewanella algae TaxID=38313 RepID=UPI00222F85CE|nr:hypothetical protein [Shewanella algae]UZD56848.1 hypothetical protein OLL83_002557 [Shewanella algae]